MKYGLLCCARNDRNLLTNIPLVCIFILDTVGMYVEK